MINQKASGWARIVFMGFLVAAGCLVSKSAVLAADATTVVDISSTSTSIMEPTVLTFTAATSSFAIQEQEFVGVLGQSVQADLHVVGGTAPYRWSLIASGLPDGVFFDQTTGRLGGSPNRTGRFTFTVQADDAMRTTVSKVLTLNVVMADDPRLNQGNGAVVPQPVIIDLDNITDAQLAYLVDAFHDDAPLIYVGPNAPTSILKINIAQMRIKPNGLYRVDGGTASMVNETHKYADVYYVDPNGRRHAFPTEAVFQSWYPGEATIVNVPDWKISNIPLRQNVSFRPGTIVRLESTQEYYRVLPGRTLKKIEGMVTNGTQTTPVLLLSQIADYVFDGGAAQSWNDGSQTMGSTLNPGSEMSAEEYQ